MFEKNTQNGFDRSSKSKDSRIFRHFFEELVSTMGIEQAAQKLVSYILESNDVSGPDSIGITGERLKRFFFDVESGYEKKEIRENISREDFAEGKISFEEVEKTFWKE